MGNRDRESYPKYHMQLIDYLDEIVNLGADSVTIAIPYPLILKFVERSKQKYHKLF
jgi:hypothetical protein